MEEVLFSIIRPYCRQLSDNGYQNLREQWYWINEPLQSGVRIRPYVKDGEYTIVVTEISKHPETDPDTIFRRIMEYLLLRIGQGWDIKKIVFQKGGYPIPDFFINFLKENGICLELISDEGNGHIESELLCW